MTAKRAYLDLFDIYAVDKYLALLYVVISADKRQYGGLTRACGAYEGNSIAGFYLEGNVLQHPFVLDIGEPYVFEFDIALDLVELDGVGLVHYLGNYIKYGIDLFGGGKCCLQTVELLCKVLNGVKELVDI